MEFLKNQSVFKNGFGETPIIQSVNPTSITAVTCLKHVCLYADRYMLDVFLDIWREDYVGWDKGESAGKLVHKICTKILSLKQESTPHDLYAKYIDIISGLPEDANLWSLTLCSTFFSALSTHLKDKME